MSFVTSPHITVCRRGKLIASGTKDFLMVVSLAYIIIIIISSRKTQYIRTNASSTCRVAYIYWLS